MRCSLSVSSRRRILCVFPAYTPSFGTFSHAYPLMGGVKAFMPPQGLLLIAAYMPETWECRFVDENIRPASAKDFAWADAVFVSGMHIQEGQIHDIGRRAHAAGKVAALGGPSVSGAPEKYPDFDYLHVGEIGDATDRLIEILDRDLSRPAAQVVLDTKERLALSDFPAPAYEAAPLKRYLIGSLQFSSGCPYRCEFCDIPQLYGRQPRLKSPEQMCAELDAIISQPGHPAVVYFVDDNFIANRKATREMLPHLVEWQKKNNYPLQFACEATLNMAKQPEILELMRQANFMTVFVGIETPEADALKGIDKTHNAAVPMYEAIETLNSYGLEVTSGIILGLDSDSDKSEQNLIDFIDKSAIPVLTINLLQALPKTPLWDRLQREGRLLHDASLESNVLFKRPHDTVVNSWRRAIAHAYTPSTCSSASSTSAT
ncbi:B12-binding domain-containing radical SAM protein [Methylorubrum sp. GM97]|nr:B12-binding domain-containing radical SAM protein [Methylorubrum sp. GM97]